MDLDNEHNEKRVEILVIDDDKIARKVVRRSLENHDFILRSAANGEDGIAAVMESLPDIILLDVEMPGLNGYEVCEQLRNTPEASDTPIIFLSSHSSLRERMLGYEAGGDDYLIKPFEPDNLVARIKVLIKYRNQRQELESQYTMAQKAVSQAMSSSCDLGTAMRFVEKSYTFKSYQELALGVFDVTERMQLKCCLLINSSFDAHWFSSDDVSSPLERELVEMSDKAKRFIDFGDSTIVNYPNISLLVKNMPLDDMDRYGRIKDIFPVLLSASDAKINALDFEQTLEQQNKDLFTSFGKIRSSFFYMAKNLMANQDQTIELLRKAVIDINEDLLRMGLEEDQEEKVLARIDTAIDEIADRIDSDTTLYNAFTTIRTNLKQIVDKQELIIEAFTIGRSTSCDTAEDDFDDDIELF